MTSAFSRSSQTCQNSKYHNKCQSFEAQTGNELADAYDDVRDSLGETLGEEIEITKELTWRWALAAFLFLSLAWALSLWWLRGMV